MTIPTPTPPFPNPNFGKAFLITLRENVQCKDGAEYLSIWGICASSVWTGWIKIGLMQFPMSDVASMEECAKPTLSHTPEPQFKGDTPETTEQSFKHIYYSE